jgi:hypothetical protein
MSEILKDTSLDVLHPVHSRRGFLTMLGTVAVGTLMAPEALAGRVVWPIEDEYDVTTWKREVCAFTNYVLPRPQARKVQEYVASAGYERAYDGTWSGQFSSPVRLRLRLSPVSTVYTEVTFELDQLPYYDRMNPCRRSKDLNSVELERLLSREEREYYNCVLSPCSAREPLTAHDHDLYQRSVADDYHISPKAYVPQYARNFTNGESTFRGIGAVRAKDAKSNLPLKNVFLTGFDLT